MPEFRYIRPDEMAERHRAPSRQTNHVQRQPVQRNVETILSLGDVRYMGYRNRVYRVPPVPYKLGQKVLDTQTKALGAARHVVKTGSKDSSDEFYTVMNRLVTLLWTHVRPTGKIRRALWHCGLMPNPFRHASEAEVNQLVDFFLRGRMTSSVRSISEADLSL